MSSVAGYDLRKGKGKHMHSGTWLPMELDYVHCLIRYFKAGLVDAMENVPLRAYLAAMLDCDPMRITKKFRVGKVRFRKASVYSPYLRKIAAEELNERRIAFIQSVNQGHHFGQGPLQHTSPSHAMAPPQDLQVAEILCAMHRQVLQAHHMPQVLQAQQAQQAQQAHHMPQVLQAQQAQQAQQVHHMPQVLQAQQAQQVHHMPQVLQAQQALQQALQALQAQQAQQALQQALQVLKAHQAQQALQIAQILCEIPKRSLKRGLAEETTSNPIQKKKQRTSGKEALTGPENGIPSTCGKNGRWTLKEKEELARKIFLQGPIKLHSRTETQIRTHRQKVQKKIKDNYYNGDGFVVWGNRTIYKCLALYTYKDLKGKTIMVIRAEDTQPAYVYPDNNFYRTEEEAEKALAEKGLNDGITPPWGLYEEEGA